MLRGCCGVAAGLLRGRALRVHAPDMVSSASLVEPVMPLEHQVARSSSLTASTQAVNCAMRPFSTMPSRPDFIASLGVVGTLKILPPAEPLR